MSHHRYGRHGPDAWLRRYQQRFCPSDLPAVAPPSVALTPVVPPTIARIFLPANTERIIFIIVNQPQEFDEENTDRQIIEMPFTTLQSTGEMRRISSLDEELAKMVHVRVIDDIDEIQGLIRRGKFVTIRDDRFESRASNFAKEDIRLLHGDWQGNYQRLLTAYRDLYKRYHLNNLGQPKSKGS